MRAYRVIVLAMVVIVPLYGQRIKTAAERATIRAEQAECKAQCAKVRAPEYGKCIKKCNPPADSEPFIDHSNLSRSVQLSKTTGKVPFVPEVKKDPGQILFGVADIIDDAFVGLTPLDEASMNLRLYILDKLNYVQMSSAKDIAPPGEFKAVEADLSVERIAYEVLKKWDIWFAAMKSNDIPLMLNRFKRIFDKELGISVAELTSGPPNFDNIGARLVKKLDHIVRTVLPSESKTSKNAKKESAIKCMAECDNQRLLSPKRLQKPHQDDKDVQGQEERDYINCMVSCNNVVVPIEPVEQEVLSQQPAAPVSEVTPEPISVLIK